MNLKQLKRNIRIIGSISILTVLCLSYQNCARTRFTLNDELKAKTLDSNPIFGGTDMMDDGRSTPTGGTDVASGVPGASGGTDGSSGAPDAVGGMDPGSDVKIPDGGADPASQAIYAKFDLVCPLAGHFLNSKKTEITKASEIKLVFEEAFPNKPTCVIHNVKDMILKNRQVDVSACKEILKKKIVRLLVLPESATSDYNAQDLVMMPAKFSADERVPVYYTNDTDKANRGNCDEIGDPLLVQLLNKGKQTIDLTSAQNGQAFDLLGKKNNYEKVRTAWFANSNSENYYLVLPNAEGKVLGIDQMFGDATRGPDGKFSRHGFQALAKHDENRDQVISDEDAVFSKLRLWKDENLDGIAQEKELFTLDQKEVAAMDLKYDKRYREKDQHGNIVKFKAIVIMKDSSYSLAYDLWLRYESLK